MTKPDQEDDGLPEGKDLPDWVSLPDVPIPPALDKKWRAQEKTGLRASVCRECGFPFTQEELSCLHCGTVTEIPSGVFYSLKRWFLGRPLGIIVLCVILAALAASLVLI
jgi:hypothetical protein